MKIKQKSSRDTNKPSENLNEIWAEIIISELVKASVKHFLIAPGSRSTPLTLAAAENPIAKTSVHFDERGLAYHALGIAKASNSPVCLICTSGTAIANFYPAIIEASLDSIPLIILSGDRPPELRDIGSNQTIDQVKMFGRYLRWEFDLPCPTDEISQDFVKATIDHAFFRATTLPPGPVLINVMFREPLLVIDKKKVEIPLSFPLPRTRYYKYEKKISSDEISSLASLFSGCEKGLIVVGKMEPCENYEALFSLAMRLQWPIFADALSGVRSMGRDSSLICYYNHILKTTIAKETMTPEIILHFGSQIVSKPLLKWIETLNQTTCYHISPLPSRYDPNHQVSEKIEMSPIVFCEELLKEIKAKPPGMWLSLWKEYSLHIEELILEFFEKSDSLSEPYSIHTLLSQLREDLLLFFGNSMPIRYADNFFFPKDVSGMVFCNRGASGIDGNLATILGIAKGAQKPVLAVIGDQTFLHDVNSLALLNSSSLSVTILLLNNFGGGIFYFLPVRERKEQFDEFIKASHTFTAKPFVEGFGASYKAPKDLNEFETVLQTSLMTPGVTVIELFTDGQKNHELHEELDAFLTNQMAKNKKEKELCYYGKGKK